MPIFFKELFAFFLIDLLQESEQKCSRAQASLGDYYIAQQNYSEALQHYELHNRLQPLVFRTLANAAFCT